MEFKVTTNKNGKVEISVEVTADDIAHGKEHALQVFAPHVEVTGFRKGKAPHNLIEKNVKEEKLVEETISHVAKDAYEKVLSENKIAPITEPHVTINELKETESGISADVFWPQIQKKGTSLTITTFTRPNVQLGKWEDAVKGVEKPEIVEEKPVIETATSIQDAKSKAETTNDQDKELVEHIKDTKQKKEQVQRAYDEKIIDALIDASTVDIADELITGETQQMIMHNVKIVQQLGIDYKDFLKNQGKTIEDVERESRDAAERSIKGRFVLAEISKQFEKDLPKNATYQQVLAFVKEKVEGKGERKKTKE